MTYLARFKNLILKLWQQKWFLPVTVLSLLVVLLVFFSLFVVNSLPEPRHDIFAGRDFKRSPFELTDAYDICYESIKLEHPRGLLTSYMDDLSTYYDERIKAYLIVVDINVGDGSKSVAGKVYCTINPVNYQVTYYKEVIEGQGSVFSRTIGVLSRVIGGR